MKNTNKVAIATLATACLVCGVVGLTACEPAVVTKITLGDNYIGTVTSEGKTLDVEGTVDTEYKLTATVGGKTCDDVLITVGEAAGTGWTIFTYAEDTTVTFTSVSDDVAKVTVVMEKYEAPNVEPPVTTTYDLTVDTPVELTNLKSGDNFSIKFNTEDDKTYTVTVSDTNVKFVNRVPGEDNYSSPKSFDGAEYVDYGNIATVPMTAEADVATVTILLSVADTVVSGDDPVDLVAPEVTLGQPVNFDLDSENAVNDYVYYKLVITDGGEYSITTDIGSNKLLLFVGTGADTANGGVNGEVSANEGYYSLAADTTYYIALLSENDDWSNFTGSFTVNAKPAD